MDRIISFIIVNENAFARAKLRSLLELEFCFVIVAEAKDVMEALALVEKHRPNIVIIDISKSTLIGIEATRTISSKFLSTKVILCGMKKNKNYSDLAYAAGASLVFFRGSDGDEILMTLRAHSRKF